MGKSWGKSWEKVGNLLSDGGDLLGDGVKVLGDGVDLLGDGVDLLVDGVDLLGDGVDLLGDGVDLLGDGGDPRSIAVGSSKTTVAQKIGNPKVWLTDLPTYLLTYTWVGARDTCVSKKDIAG